MKKRMTRMKWRRTKKGHMQSKRWKRRCKKSRPKKEAIPLMRWDISFLYFFLIPFSTIEPMIFIWKVLSHV